MSDFSALVIRPVASIRDAIRVIDHGAQQVALVTDEGGALQGTVTDGDIRRGLLRGESMDAPVERVMRRDFRALPEGASAEDAMALMRRELLHQVPVLDAGGRVVRLITLEDLLQPQPRSNWVVLMAGGQGQRLRPLTDSVPKPMLTVGGRPILELMLERCSEAGFGKFFVSVNYLKDRIVEHFGDGSRWGVDVTYLSEERPLGTAGSLGLLKESPSEPIIVMNGDVLSRVDLAGLLRFHQEHLAAVTVCVREYETRIPFGVVESDGVFMTTYSEKPIMTHHVSAGIYVLAPEVLALVKAGEPMDMPQLLQLAQSRGHRIAVFPIHEYWLDIGNAASLETANGDWR
jgi:dTDP-glucose pyrophosphorylase